MSWFMSCALCPDTTGGLLNNWAIVTDVAMGSGLQQRKAIAYEQWVA